MFTTSQILTMTVLIIIKWHYICLGAIIETAPPRVIECENGTAEQLSGKIKFCEAVRFSIWCFWS